VAVALTFSSTIIIVKLLSDKRELDSLHGRIAVGFLIVQDLAVVIAMMAMSALRGTGAADAGLLGGALSLGWRLTAAGVLLFVLMRWVLPRGGGVDGALAGAAAGVCHRLGRGAGGAGRMGRLQQGGRRLPGRLLAGLHTVPRSHERAADRHPRLPAAVLLHRPGRQARLLHAGRRGGAGACCRCSC
jgi:hypothetical protein